MPKVWKKVLIVALSKLKEDPKSYRPISMLCVSYKIFERLIHAHDEPIIIDQPFFLEQTRFRRGSLTVDQE